MAIIPALIAVCQQRLATKADLLFPDHVVLIGDNNTGKSTILEAIDLVLGPDRLNRRPPIDEHDFYIGKYLSSDASNESVEEPAEPAEAGDSEAAADEVEVTAGGGGRA